MASAISKHQAVQQVVGALAPAMAGIDPADLPGILTIAAKILADRSPDARTAVENMRAGSPVSAELLSKLAGVDIGDTPVEQKARSVQDLGATVGNNGKVSAQEATDKAPKVAKDASGGDQEPSKGASKPLK